MLTSTKRVPMIGVIVLGAILLGLGGAGVLSTSTSALASTCQGPVPSAQTQSTVAAPVSGAVPATADNSGAGGSAGSGTLVNTNAPVQAPSPASAAGTSGSPLVNTNAPITVGSGSPGGSSAGSGTLVNTNAPVQAQSPITGTSGSPLVNTNAPIQGAGPLT